MERKIKAKDVLPHIPKQCSCEIKLLPNLVNSKSAVKGYVNAVLCPYCKSKREEERFASIRQDKVERASLLIARRMREIAIKQLVSEGKIKKADDDDYEEV